MRSILLMSLLLLASGCGPTAFERFYVPRKADANPLAIKTSDVRVYEAGAKPVDEMMVQLHPDAVVLGESEFEAGNQSRRLLTEFAAKIGADVVIWQSEWLDRTVEHDTRVVPRHDTTTITTTGPDGQVTSTITTTRHDVERVSTVRDLYRHHVLYLRRADGK